MKKQLPNYLFILSLLVFACGDLFACSGFDLVYTNFTITAMGSSSYSYTYTIKNIGTQAVALKNIYIQNYVSTSSSTTGAPAAGGSDIAFASTDSLQPGESYTGTMGANTFPGDGPDNYPYLIAELNYYDSNNPTVNDCDPSNNKEVVSLYPNAVVDTVVVTNIATGAVTYNYTIKNAGVDTLFLNELTIYDLVSKDSAIDITSISCDTTTASSGNDYVTVGATYTGSFTAAPPDTATTDNYPYLALYLSYAGTETSTTDNTYVAKIVVSSATGVANASVQQAANTVVWNSDAKSFQVIQWVNAANNISYKISSVTGTTVASGSAAVNQSVTVTPMAEGMYILSLTDGQAVYATKFVY